MSDADAALLLADGVEKERDHHDPLAGFDALFPIGCIQLPRALLTTNTVLHNVAYLCDFGLQIAVARNLAALHFRRNALPRLVEVDRRVIEGDGVHYNV